MFKKTILVTGAAGFIGSNLCTYLLESCNRVIGFDDFSTGKPANVDRIAEIGNDAFKFVEGDIRDRKAVSTALAKCDVSVHLAAQVSVPRSLADPEYNHSVNVKGFQTALTAAAEAGIGLFVYASSCAVYGDNPSLPLDEKEPPAPISPYADSKLANELYASSLAPDVPATTIIGLRLFNIFGPWQDSASEYAAVIPKWINARLKKERPDLFGDGSASRDFCHVDNLCSLIADIGEAKTLPTGLVFNVGSGQRTTLAELDQVILESLREVNVEIDDSSCNHLPWDSGNILHSLADISLAKNTLGYEPLVDLNQGIRQVLAVEYQIGSTAPSRPHNG